MNRKDLLMEVFIKFGVNKFTFAYTENNHRYIEDSDREDDLIDEAIKNKELFRYALEDDDGYYFFKITNKGIKYLKGPHE